MRSRTRKYLQLLAGCLLSINAYAESVWDKPSGKISGAAEITVYRSPSCGCCGRWLTHMEQQGFKVTDIKIDDVNPIKQKYDVPPQLASCHTAVIQDYVIEGHVPAGDIKRLLADKPDLVGLSVPAMPAGTPGMEVGGRKDPFSVVSFDKQGRSMSYRDYRSY